jgi:taurine transport system substrate-binding protein
VLSKKCYHLLAVCLVSDPLSGCGGAGAETVDAVVAMAKALGTLPHAQRRNGSLVRAAIQNTSFAGVSGQVEFDANGDLMNPRFTVLHLGPRSNATGKYSWRNVGTVGAQSGQSSITTSQICWAVSGCGVVPPSDEVMPPARSASMKKPLVRMGYFTESQPFAVACARGWFSTAEYDVGCFPQSSGGYAVSKLDGGDLDIAQLGSTPIAVSNSRGVDVLTFGLAHGMSRSQSLVAKRAVTPLELLGMRLACPFGSTAHFHLLYLLDTLKIPVCAQTEPRGTHPQCVVVLNKSPSAIIKAWDDNNIDGAFCWGHAQVYMRTHGGTVTIHSDSLKRWGRETFIVMAASRKFATAHPEWLQRVLRMKMLLDQSWLDSSDDWQISSTGTNYLASVGHLAGLPAATVAERVRIRQYMDEREYASVAEQLSCAYFGQPNRGCGSDGIGTARAISATSEFFLGQKGLATMVPTGKWVDERVRQLTSGGSSLYAAMVDSRPLFLASQQNTTLATELVNASSRSAIKPAFGGSWEAGDCNASLTWVQGTVGKLTDMGADIAAVPGASYKDNLHCLWAIPAPAQGSTVLVNFTSLRVWSGDSVRVYSGAALNGSRPTGQLLAQLSGIDHRWPALRGTKEAVLVEFTTDENTEQCYNLPEEDGWSLTYSRVDPGCVSAADCSHRGTCENLLCNCISGWAGADCSHPSCLGTHQAKKGASTGVFMSDAAALMRDHQYPNSADCVFETRGSQGQHVTFQIQLDLEESFDFLEVRSGTGPTAVIVTRLTGYLNTTITVPTIQGTASLRFLTDNKGRRSGFRATFERNQPTAGSCAHLGDCSGHGACACTDKSCACACENGWSGVDCSLSSCSLAPLVIQPSPGAQSGSLVSNAAGTSVPALAGCQWSIGLSSTSFVGVRLFLRNIDLEPSRPGDFKDFLSLLSRARTNRRRTQASQTPHRLTVQTCSSDQDCGLQWHTGRCLPSGTCAFRHSIDIVGQYDTLSVQLTTDRNDGNLSYTGVAVDWATINRCQITNVTNSAEHECRDGVCDCEMSGGRCTVDGACTSTDGTQSACGCGGTLVRKDEGPSSVLLILGVVGGALTVLGGFIWQRKRNNDTKHKLAAVAAAAELKKAELETAIAHEKEKAEEEKKAEKEKTAMEFAQWKRQSLTLLDFRDPKVQCQRQYRIVTSQSSVERLHTHTVRVQAHDVTESTSIREHGVSLLRIACLYLHAFDHRY